MASRFLSLLTLALFASCSVVLDSQYGLRFEPIPQRAEPRTESANGAIPSPHFAVETPGVPYTNPTVAAEFAADVLAVNPMTEAVEQPEWTEFAVQRITEPAAEAYEQTAVDQYTAVDQIWPRKKPERSMTWAWVLWAIPALLTLAAAGGLLLNFGAHWYYLGNRRKGIMRTIVWALTLVVTSMVYFFAAVLSLDLVAALLAIFLLIPLAVIQIVTMVTDFFALQKIAAKRARRANRGNRSNRKQTIT
jgi:hypothetical protein